MFRTTSILTRIPILDRAIVANTKMLIQARIVYMAGIVERDGSHQIEYKLIVIAMCDMFFKVCGIRYDRFRIFTTICSFAALTV
jgi:hypothetical protein